jgi:hypothetical protein
MANEIIYGLIICLENALSCLTFECRIRFGAGFEIGNIPEGYVDWASLLQINGRQMRIIVWSS